MSEEQADQVAKIHDALLAANNDWPPHVWHNSDYYAVYLERALARAIGNRDVEYVSATVDAKARRDVQGFEATVFTRWLVITGRIAIPQVGAGERVPYPDGADVAVIPRRAIKAVSLHNLEQFGSESETSPDVVEFSLTVDGREPIRIKPQSSDRNTGASSKLLDTIIEDLEMPQTGA